jgi:hypothetical protein
MRRLKSSASWLPESDLDIVGSLDAGRRKRLPILEPKALIRAFFTEDGFFLPDTLCR